ncbi:hypothetical protein PVL29_024725 [Vitis rotundifolia]|uniref:TIR domain-containing protein n=1 Tax=Vitis rotundifolia TaxID=103349 RepID=A0AA39D9Q8_VITRO|nr:hypothetical protein PVL29_024725 [Vitis rotundifolia]
MSRRIGQTASSSSSSSRPSTCVVPFPSPPRPPQNTTLFEWKFDIFLSFRGKDTRRNFTDHLYTALVERGLRPFRDDEDLQRGEMIDENLLQAIKDSAIFIIIFSENYAHSKWCLNELVEIMKRRAEGRKVYPIFYHVEPSMVRKQSGNYGKAFENYENNSNLQREQIQKWRTALKEAGSIAGCHITNQYESQIVKEISGDMFREIVGEHCIEDGLVGKDSRLEPLKKLMISKPNDVLMVGIYGLSGTGKTTFARALYEEISCQFDGASFLANIGEVSKEDDLHCLQERLFCDILLGENQEIRPFHRRSNLMKKKICCKKVLIILDDVNIKKQLEILVGERDWFGKGSRIIITAKKKNLLLEHKVDELYQIKDLGELEALHLFSHHANTKGVSMDLSMEVINYCGVLPLNLKVVGTFLRDKDNFQQQLELQNLARVPAGENPGIRVSYNGLHPRYKNKFLDIACFFKGEHKDFVTKMLHEHDFPDENGIEVLTDRCLITVSERKLWMHSIIQKLGWEIDKGAAKAAKAAQPCRYWDLSDIQRLFRQKKGMQNVEGISLDLSKSKDIEFSTEVFKKMTELKLLKVFLGSDCVDGKENYKVNFSTDFRLPCSLLRYLHWHGYCLEFYPSNFEAPELFELSMPYSCLQQIKGNEIRFPKLTTLNLSHSRRLENISNFSGMPNLERLVLEGCRSLVKVDLSIGNLNKLSFMNLKDCKRLNSLPKSICKLKFLETLILTGCSRLEKLLDDLEEQQRSVNLEAIRTYRRVITLPPKLRILHLGHCRSLQGIPKLPSSIQEVDAYNCTSIRTLSWNIELRKSILPRIQVSLYHVKLCYFQGRTLLSFS